MNSQDIPDDFYERIKPKLHRRIGREVRLAYRALDLGCGSCELVRFLREVYHQRVTGVDVSEGGFPRRDSPSKSRHPMRCVKADAAKLDFVRNGAVDAVVSMWALHEMKDVDAALAEAHRVLRPGGKMLIVDFPRGSLAQRLWDEGYYAAQEIDDMLRQAGFVEVRAKTIERDQVIWAKGYRRPRKGPQE